MFPKIEPIRLEMPHLAPRFQTGRRALQTSYPAGAPALPPPHPCASIILRHSHQEYSQLCGADEAELIKAFCWNQKPASCFIRGMKLRSAWIAGNWGGSGQRDRRPGMPVAGRFPWPEPAPARPVSVVSVVAWTTRAFAVALKREADDKDAGADSGWKPAL